MLGSRALYHDGWKAVVFHPPPLHRLRRQRPDEPFDDDVWELYHVAEDFSEVHDLAASTPRSSRSCRRCGGRRPGSTRCSRSTTSRAASATRATDGSATSSTGSVGPIAEAIAPNLRNRPALRDRGRPRADGPGADARRGDRRARQPRRRLRGVRPRPPPALHLQLRRHRDHDRHRRGRAARTSPSTVSVRFTRTGAGGDVELRYGDVPVGRGTIPVTTPLTYGAPGFHGRVPAGRSDRPRLRRSGRVSAGRAPTRRHRGDRTRSDPIRDARPPGRPGDAVVAARASRLLVGYAGVSATKRATTRGELLRRGPPGGSGRRR